MKQDETILAASLILSKQRKYGNEFYAPRGLLCDYNNKQLITEFTKSLKQFVKQKNGYVLRIEPYILLKERDIDGKEVVNGINNEKVISSLTKIGYKYYPECEQAKWMFVLNLEGKTKEDIFKEMRPNTRNLIKRAEKNQVTICELSRDELPLFKQVTSDTSDRRNFVDKTLEYYQDMYDLFKDDIKYMIAEIDLQKLYNSLNDELNTNENKIMQMKDNKNNQGKLKEAMILSESLRKRLDEVSKELENKTTLVLSVGSFILYGDEIIYLNSGNYQQYMHYNGQYLLQWTMIQYGIEQGYRQYNFYGITGNFDKKDSSYGIYEFKKGFNGYVIENIGTFELPINIMYHVQKIIRKIKG